MITYAVESFKECILDMKPLLEDHWEEVALYKDKVKLKIDVERYLALEEAGVLHIVTARDNGVLVGYCVSLINNHLHYSDTVYALNDVIFLDIPYRHSGVTEKMYTYAEDRLKELGVHVVLLHMKVDHPFVSLCSRLGFDKAEYNFSKYIGE